MSAVRLTALRAGPATSIGSSVSHPQIVEAATTVHDPIPTASAARRTVPPVDSRRRRQVLVNISTCPSLLGWVAEQLDRRRRPGVVSGVGVGVVRGYSGVSGWCGCCGRAQDLTERATLDSWRRRRRRGVGGGAAKCLDE